LTESASILKIPNRRGFQSKLDFLAILRIRGPGDPLFGILDPAGVSFTSTPRGGGVVRESPGGVFGTPPRDGERPPGTPRGPGATPGTRVPPPGVTGGSPRGVDVKPLLARRPGPGIGDLGSWGSRDLGTGASRAPGGARGHPSGVPDLWSRRPPGPGLPDPTGSPDRGPEPQKGSPAPGGGVVLHQPLAAGPRGSRRGLSGPATPRSASPSRPPRALSVHRIVGSGEYRS